MSRRTGHGRRGFLSMAVAVALLGCGDTGDEAGAVSEDPAAPRVYVGALSGSDVRVGLVVEGGRAALFFCGGPSTLSETRWFRGAFEGERIDLTKNGAHAIGEVGAEEASGTLRTEAGDVGWNVTRVHDGSVAGLYEANDEGVAGVVVSSEDVAQGAFIAPGPSFEVFQIIVIRPIRLSSLGINVSVAGRDLVVHRVRPR